MNNIFSFSPYIKSFFIVFVLSFLVRQQLQAQSAFIENKGQWNKNVHFQSEFNSGKLTIEKNQLNYNFYDVTDLDKYLYDHHKHNHYEPNEEHFIKGHCIKTNFIGSNSNSTISKDSPINEYFNYYLGNDPKKWASKVNAYNIVQINELYKGIDLKIYSLNNSFKYDFIVKPGADSKKILMDYEGAESIRIEDGVLKVKTSVNEISELKPYAYQIKNDKKETVECRFALKDNKVYFEFPKDYDHSLSLVIDPYIVFSRYSSSYANHFGYTATYDSKENAYGAGSVFSIGMITTPGAFSTLYGGGNADIGIVKYSANGLQRLYSTYIGGDLTDLPHSLVVNSRDELYLLGTTGSADFPIDTFLTTINSTFQGGTAVAFSGLGVSYPNGSDIVVARFTEDGTNLLSSTYLGGTLNDGLNTSPFLKYNYADEIRGEILLDEDDNCYIVSCTYSTDFQTLNPMQASNAGGLDAVIVKMDENLTTILYSTYLGGSSDDAIYSIDFDQSGNLVLAGGTNSSDFPVLNPYQATLGGGIADGFIAKLHSSGSGLLSSTYYGSNAYDQIFFVEINDDDFVHIFGQTKAPQDELIFNALYNKPNGGQMLAKFSPEIDSLIWATRFGDGGGKPDISPTAFLVDVCNRVFLSGWGWNSDTQLSGTNGLDVTPDALDNSTDNQDFYFMVLMDDASSLLYGSFFGGQFSREHVDGGTSRFDKKGIVYQAVCAGCGGLQDFPTVPADSIGVWNNNNSCNLGVVKYAFSPPSIIADFSLPQVECIPTTLSFINQSQTAFNDTSQSYFIWKVNNDTVESYHLDYDFTSSGVYTITLIAIDTQSCNFIDSITKQLTIIGNGNTLLAAANVCAGNSVKLGISPISGPNISYKWTPNYFLTSDAIANPFANPPVDTTYQLIVTNGNCTDTFTQKVILGSIDIPLEPFDTVCLETEINIKAEFLQGAIYKWTPAELITSGQGTSNITLYAQNINQEINLEVTSIEGCKDFIYSNIITINNLPDLEVNAVPDTIESGQDVQLLAESFSASTLLWNANPYFNTLEIENPIAEKVLETTTFKIVADNGICPKRDSVTVYVIIPDCLEGKFFVPNAFSPNDDGNNDVFKVRTTLVNIEGFYLAVFDRWGNKVFSSNDKNEAWDGTYKGKKLSPNVYGWYTEGICPNGENYFLKGNVTLLK